ncbi:ATP-binding protein [uncultured Flavobacterium sp.]|uniref:sensor histidine kinase n=1 Tax=uncultured Flavobacterium sp. TaxID=165435 RepID=UPI0030C7DC71
MNHETDFNQADYRYLLHNLVQSIDEVSQTNYTCTIDSSIEWDSYSSVTKINVYRVLQELFSNVNKYAQAEKCNAKISIEGDLLLITVVDDGVGFDTAQTPNGIGMKNIKERIKTVKGKINIKSVIGEGTLVYIEIPQKKKTK